MSNQSENKQACDNFRKEIKALLGDLADIDKKVLNRSVNAGIAYAKKKTPVGLHPNPVTFTVKHGPHAGETVSFKTAYTRVGGYLRKHWKKTPIKASAHAASCELLNAADYASYWNDGHRIVSRKGATLGFVKGTHLLEETVDYVGNQMSKHFEAELRKVKKKHGA